MTVSPITSDQSKQFKRLVEDAIDRALDEVNPDKGGIQRLFERGGEFQAYVVAGVSRFTSNMLPDYSLARLIMGEDFISADEIATARGLAYAEKQLIELGKKLPNRATLRWCRDNGMILVAGPSFAMTMLDVRAVHADFFYSRGPGPEQDDSGWYDDARETFARTDKVEALCWIAFRKEPVEDSRNLTWPDQQALVAEPMMVPNAAEATWALTTYKTVRDIYLLDELYVRTSSVDSDGSRVDVGVFDADGLRVNGCWDGVRGSGLGVSASRKF